MRTQTITIPRQEYKELKMKAKLDVELLEDIARGIKNILTGKVKEV